jgi:rhodanese-related sulfurtransferase
LTNRVTELISEGYTYIDVRTEAEFAEGHPVGSWNVPITVDTASGVRQNGEFVRMMGAHFNKDAKLILGCATGACSQFAAKLLTEAGYTDVVDSVTGYIGTRDSFGKKTPGWVDCGLPIETGQPSERSYASLRRAKKPSEPVPSAGTK